MRTRQLAGGVIAILLLGVSLVPSFHVASAEAPVPKLAFRPIVFETPDGPVDAERATLRLPEKRSERSGRRVRLAVVRFPATTARTSSPVVLLEGGPGSSGIDTAGGRRYELIERLRRYGDVIVFDQRGVGASRPRLSCAGRADIPPDEVITESSWLAGVDAPSRQCVRRWRDRGVDLAAYNTGENADDVNDLRAALGAERITLWGASYGTQLALTVMRRHPDRVERAILHGILGPDQYLVLPRTTDKVVKRLGRLAARDGAAPDMVGALERVLDRLEQEPARVTIDDPQTGSPIEVAVGPWEVKFVINFVVLGQRSLMRMLPAAITLADAGDLSTFARLGLRLRRFEPFAMRMAMACTTPVNERRQRKVERQEPRSILGSLPSIEGTCKPWQVPPLDEAFLDPVTADIPTLLISGTLDATTPPANANVVGRTLSRSHQLVLVNGTHSDLVHGDDRILDAIEEFLAGRPPSTRRLRLPPWSFDP